jgi:hypothetical protein
MLLTDAVVISQRSSCMLHYNKFYLCLPSLWLSFLVMQVHQLFFASSSEVNFPFSIWVLLCGYLHPACMLWSSTAAGLRCCLACWQYQALLLLQGFPLCRIAMNNKGVNVFFAAFYCTRRWCVNFRLVFLSVFLCHCRLWCWWRPPYGKDRDSTELSA